MQKTIEEQVKELILAQYGDMKSFALQAGIPNSTLSSIFQRGILKATIGRIIQLADALNISVDGLAVGKVETKIKPSREDTKEFALTSEEVTHLKKYRRLDDTDKAKTTAYMDGLLESDKYRLSQREQVG